MPVFKCSVFYRSFFCFKQKTAYEMRISDWSSDVCSSDLDGVFDRVGVQLQAAVLEEPGQPVPVAQRVADVGGQRGPGGDHRQLLLEPGFQGRDDRRRIFFASGKPSLWRRAAHCRLDRAQLGAIGKASGRARGGTEGELLVVA